MRCDDVKQRLPLIPARCSTAFAHKIAVYGAGAAGRLHRGAIFVSFVVSPHLEVSPNIDDPLRRRLLCHASAGDALRSAQQSGGARLVVLDLGAKPRDECPHAFALRGASLKAAVHRFRHVLVQMRVLEADEPECSSAVALWTPVRQRVGQRPRGIDAEAVERYWQDLVP